MLLLLLSVVVVVAFFGTLLLHPSTFEIQSLYVKYCFCSFSKMSVYNTSCPNNCFMNLFRRLFVRLIITIYYLELHTSSLWNDVIGVEEEVLILVPLYIIPVVLSQTNQCMIQRVPTSALRILCGDLFLFTQYPQVHIIIYLFQCDMVYLVWRR